MKTGPVKEKRGMGKKTGQLKASLPIGLAIPVFLPKKKTQNHLKGLARYGPALCLQSRRAATATIFLP
jgi:hypothetical protein